jgi:hypothetical protein
MGRVPAVRWHWSLRRSLAEQDFEEREGVLEMLNGHSSIGFGRAIQVAAGTSATPG